MARPHRLVGPYRRSQPPEIETFIVRKQSNNGFSYKLDGENYSETYVKSLGKYKFKYSKNMTAEDIIKVENKFLKENV